MLYRLMIGKISKLLSFILQTIQSYPDGVPIFIPPIDLRDEIIEFVIDNLLRDE